MFRTLRRPVPSRAVGLVAAYALALQMLLAGVIATRMAVAGATLDALCFGIGSSTVDPGGDIDHAPHRLAGDPCAICAFASLTPPAPVPAGLTPPQARRRPRRIARDKAARPEKRRREPRTSRGPPPAA